MKEKVYEVKFNEKGEKVCIIRNKEIKIISEKDGKFILENGKVLNMFLQDSDILAID